MCGQLPYLVLAAGEFVPQLRVQVSSVCVGNGLLDDVLRKAILDRFLKKTYPQAFSEAKPFLTQIVPSRLPYWEAVVFLKVFCFLLPITFFWPFPSNCSLEISCCLFATVE